MSNETKKYFCPRLIDFVIVVGCKEPATPSQLLAKHLHQQKLYNQHQKDMYEQSLPPEYMERYQQQQKQLQQSQQSALASVQQPHLPLTQLPELLRRYPLDDHNDFMLPQDVTYFCQPEGCSHINCSSQQRANSNRDTTSFIFSLTEKDSARVRYGVCINFFRPIEKKADSKRAAGTVRQSKTNANDKKPQHDSDDEEASHGQSSSSLSPHKHEKRRKKKASHVKYTHTLTSLCIISHHPFFSLFRECLNILRRIIEACHARSLASSKSSLASSPSSTQSNSNSTATSSNSRDTVWGILTGSSGSISTDQMSSLIACEIKEIETWILRLLSAPVPVPGKTKLIIDILPNESPMLFALPDHTRFNLVDFPLHLPLELLGVDACIKIFTLILLEHKVLFQSSDYNALSMSIMAFVAMLYPLEYMFPVIPLLPRCMNETEQLLLAPTPFIIGIPASFFQYKNSINLPDDVWLIDLDKNKIFYAQNGEPIPELPEPELSILRTHLNQALASLSSSPQPVKNFEVFFHQQSSALQNSSNKRENLDLISKSFNPLIYGNDIDSVDVATRITMVQFLNSKNVLGNFNEHTRILRLYPRPVVAFQYNSFIRSRPIKSNFIVKMAKTQAVEFLAEWSLCPNNVAYLRIQTGIFDPSLIGDKPKWYCRYLSPVQFCTYEEKSTLAAAIQYLNQEEAKQVNKIGEDEYPTDASIISDRDDNENDKDVESSSSSSSSLCADSSNMTEAISSPTSESLTKLGTDTNNNVETMKKRDASIDSDDDRPKPTHDADGKPLGMFPKNQAKTMCVDVSDVYTPPNESDFKDLIQQSPSGLSESSSLSSSESSSSSLDQANLEKDDEPENAKKQDDDLVQDQDVSEREHLKSKDDAETKNDQLNSSIVLPSVDKSSTNEKTAVEISQNNENSSRSNQQIEIASTSQTTKPYRLSTRTESQASTTSHNEGAFISPNNVAYSNVRLRAENRKEANVHVDSPNNKKSPYSFSILSQLSDDILTDVTAKARNLSSIAAANINNNKRLASFLNGDDSSKESNKSHMRSSSSNLSIGRTATDTPTQQKLQNRKSEQPYGTVTNLSPSMRKQSEGSTLYHEESFISDQQSGDMNNENQRFLKEVLANVFDGLGVGWLKYNRVKRLMEDENYRNFVLSRLNTSLNKKLSSDEEHIEDVRVNKAVFRGMSKLLVAIIYGLEQTYANNGLGGMASAFQLLEIAHTHYWVRSSDSLGVKGDGAMSPMSEMSNSPYDSHENLNSLTHATSSASSSMYGINLMPSSSHHHAHHSNQHPHPHHVAHKLHQQQQQQQFNIQTTGNIVAQLEKKTTQTPSQADKTKSHVPLSNIEEPCDDHSRSNETLRQRCSLDTKINHHTINPQPPTIETVSSSQNANVDGKNKEPDTSSLNLNEQTPLPHESSRSSSITSPHLASVITTKSQYSSGYRYTKGCLVQVQMPSPTTQSSPLASSQHSSMNHATPTLNSSTTSSHHLGSNDQRTYLFETLVGNSRSPLWDQMQFWEDVFLDAVAQERDIIGLDQGPSEMMERYNQLGSAEKKRLELDEDHLLAVMLYNLISFMIMMRVSKDEIRRKIRRILGKCHIGLLMSQQVNELLDCVNFLSGNDADIRPAGSRLMQKQSFTVHMGTDNKGEMLFMEVCDDCMILRSVKGEIVQRWWFEKLVNMTYCPKTRVLCLWCKQEGETQLNKFYTKKCRELYFSIKEAMETAVTRINNANGGPAAPIIPELGGEFPIADLETEEKGVLRICMNGIALSFGDKKEFIELKRVRKCTTQKDDIFVLEELDPKTKKIVIRKYKSSMASLAIFAFHRVISVLVT